MLPVRGILPHARSIGIARSSELLSAGIYVQVGILAATAAAQRTIPELLRTLIVPALHLSIARATGTGLISTALRISTLSALTVLCLLLSLLPSAPALAILGILLTPALSLALLSLALLLSALPTLVSPILTTGLLPRTSSALPLLLARLSALPVALPVVLIVAASQRKALNLIPQPVDTVKRRRLRTVVSRFARLSRNCLLRGLVHLVVQLL